jgi:hypothetical protein
MIISLRPMVVVVALLLSGALGAASAGSMAAKASVKVSYRGKPVRIGDEARAVLQRNLEGLIATCSIARAAAPAKRHPELEVDLHYAKPQTTGTAVPGQPPIAARGIILDASASVNEGWPSLYLVAEREAQQLDKCDGGKILATLCTPELESLAPLKVRESCRLLPK